METRRPVNFSRPLLMVLLVATVILGLGVIVFSQESSESKASDAGFPFSGEHLVYRVDWHPPWYLFFLPPMEAGEAELTVGGEAQHEGKKALKIAFQARSSGSLASLAGLNVDDEFEILTDPGNLCTYRVSKKIREGKRKRSIETVYLADSRRLHFYEADEAVNPPKVRKDQYLNDIPECPKDLFSALYALRLKELHLGDTQQTTIGDDDKIKAVESQVLQQEVVDTPAGRFRAWKINTVSLLGGLFKDGGEFRIWLTADNRKAPVQFEVQVHLGRVTGKLKAVQY